MIEKAIKDATKKKVINPSNVVDLFFISYLFYK